MSSSAEALARRLTEVERRLTAMERGGQMSRTSIEGGTLVVNDEAGTPVLAVGRQDDGGYAVTGANGGQVVADVVPQSVIDEIAAALELADGAVTEALLAAGAVTETKIADDAVSSPKVVAGAIQAGHIAAGSIDTDKLVALAVTADKIATNAITADKIDANAITADKIAANAITGKTITGGTYRTRVAGPRLEVGELVESPTGEPAILWTIWEDGWANPYIGAGATEGGRYLMVRGQSLDGQQMSLLLDYNVLKLQARGVSVMSELRMTPAGASVYGPLTVDPTRSGTGRLVLAGHREAATIVTNSSGIGNFPHTGGFVPAAVLVGQNGVSGSTGINLVYIPGSATANSFQVKATTSAGPFVGSVGVTALLLA